MKALVLSGGGAVGRAWETGLAAGFFDEGIDWSRADLIIGTSAGAIVGAQLALGQDSHVMPVVDSPAGARPSPDAASGLRQLLAGMVRAAGSSTPELEWAAIGGMAVAAATAREEDSLARATFAAVTGQAWPPNFRATSVNTRTGRFQVWDASSGVPLDRAVASSAALPGVWPPITLGDDRYMDGGVRSMANADLAAGHAAVVVVSCFPLPKDPHSTGPINVMSGMVVGEIELLRRGGSNVAVIEPDEAFLALTHNGAQMLNNALVPEAYELGKRQARADVERVRAVWR